MQQQAGKMWITNKIDDCRLSEEEARDPTKLKASTFARWLGLGGCAIMFFAGLYVMATYDDGSGSAACMFTDSDAAGCSSNTTNTTNTSLTSAPTPAPTGNATSGGDDPVCIMSGVFCFLVSVPILLLEISYFVLKGGKELTAEEMAEQEMAASSGSGSGKGVGRGAGPDDDPKPDKDDDEGEEADEDESKPGCCGKCLGSLMRCFCCKCLYENWYVRALLYLVMSVFMFPCGMTLVCGFLLLICAFLYAFARWRGELAPMVPEESKEEDKAPEEEDDPEQAPKKEKKRRKKPAKLTSTLE